MSILQSDVAVKEANAVMDMVARIRLLRADVAELVKINADTPLGNLWTVLNTANTNADGTLAAADLTPNASHPIDTRVYPNLDRAVKSGALTDALQVLVDFKAFCDGTAVGANAARPQQINNVSM